jgi:DNA-binding transcriptional ArsR family regulator
MIERYSPTKGSRGKPAKESAQWHRRAQKAATLLKQVSDPTRVQVLQFLAQGEWSVGALCEQLKMSQPAVSHHLALLRHGGLIVPRRQGKNNFYALTAAGAELAGLVQSMIN